MKIGVLGAGHLGNIHLKILKSMPEFELVGFYDPDTSKSKEAIKKYGIMSYDSVDQLIDECEAVDIVTPTLSHLECAEKSLNRGRHIFIEKPLANSVEGGKIIKDLAKELNLKVQVGHVERFNPAFTSVQSQLEHPKFIESHRLAMFNPRGTDVSVVLDLMIHDIDIVLSVVRSQVKEVRASGVSVLSDSPDICNARVEFENGCVANFTSSRISMKNMRKTRFFQRNAYISVDFLEKKSEVVKMKDVIGDPDEFSMTIDLGEGKPLKEIYFDQPTIDENNAIEDELRSFYSSINENKEPIVSVADGYNAMKLAQQILDSMDITLKV